MTRVRFLRFSYFLWLALPLGAYGFYAAYGLPYLRWAYTWRDDGRGYAPFADRYYLRCTYQGLTQHFTINHPPGGNCPIIRFAKDGQIKEGRS